MLMHVRLTQIKNNQSGFASIVIALVLILLLSLITVGFAQLMQREQSSALDKQLSSQAYYAAESGINDAASAINKGFNVSKTKCAPYDSGGDSDSVSTLSGNSKLAASEYLDGSDSNKVGNSTGASYPCLLIDPYPPSVTYDSISVNSPTILAMTGDNPSAPTNPTPPTISSIEISWEDSNNSTNFFDSPNADCSTPKFPPAGTVGTGILQTEIIPLGNTGIMSRNELINDAYTTFLCPNSSNSAPIQQSYPGTGNAGMVSGDVLDGNCNTLNTPLYCSVKIVGLTQSTYLLVLQSIYSPTKVEITAYNSAGTLLDISGAQILIDSTGKAQDVLRRIQVRLPVQDTYNMPSGTSASQNICKQLNITPPPSTSTSSPNCPIP